MSLPAHHAWTHRPKAQGGTDPIELPETAAGGIVSHFPRHPIHVTNDATDEYTMWPGGVVVVSATHHSVTGSATTDATNNYSSQSFLRYTTTATSYAAAANLIVLDPASIGLMDDHAYIILVQYRLGSVATGIKIGWTHAGATPAEVTDTFPASSPANSWFSLAGMVTSVGVAKVQHGTNIEIRVYHTSSAVQIDIDQIFLIPNDYQDGSPPLNADPAVFDTYARTPDTGQLSSTTSIVFPDNTHYIEQCIKDTQTCYSLLDPAFRWSTTTWSQGFQASPQGSGETDAFAWEAGHGRHLYASARLQGEAGEESTAFSAGALVAYGSNGMPHASSILWNNSWQLVYLGPMSPSHEIPHLGGMVIAADPGGNEAPFSDDGETTVADVRMATLFEVTCLYDPQSV